MTIPRPGDQLGRYRIERLIGRDGMGAAFEATDPRLARQVAIKVVLPAMTEDADFRRRFEREAAVLARTRSRHIVAVHEAGEHDGCLYLVMEYLRDGDLHHWLDARGSLDRHTAVTLTSQVAEGLADAHDAGVVHRDVKPSNVLLWSRGQELIPFLCDFGIATDGDAGLTRTGTVVGSPAYMAPERHRGRPATARGDLYSLGCVLWFALIGHPPYSGTDYQLMSSHISGPIPQLKEVDDLDIGINNVLRSLMAKDPADRPVDAHAAARLLRDLGDAAQHRPGPDDSDATVLDRTTLRPVSSTSAAPTLDPTPDPTPNPVPVGAWRPSEVHMTTAASGRPAILIGLLIVALALVLAAGVGVYAIARSTGNQSTTAGAATVDDSSTPADTPSTQAAPQTDGASADAEAPSPTYPRCTADASPSLGQLVVTGLVPMTGSNAEFGAPMQAGIGLAVADVAASSDPGGPSPCYTMLDSRDSDAARTTAGLAAQVLETPPSVVVGPYSYAAVDSVDDALIDAGMMAVSPAATLFAISGRSAYLARTISSGYVEADVLAQLVMGDSHTRVAFVTPDAGYSPYGTSMRGAVEDQLATDGASCAYGCSGAGQEFPAGTDDFSSVAAGVVASGADAVVVTALSGGDVILRALAEAGST